MILEGIVTTLSETNEVNIAPMGPIWETDGTRLILRPFATAQTYRNLKANREGVFHITDDVLLLAQSAIGKLESVPVLVPASRVQGFVLAEACRYYEFRVRSIDEREARVRIETEIVHEGRLRDFFGFNRAKHAVLEAAILATRTAFSPLDEIEREFQKLAAVVQKTGGTQEHQAFEFLENFLQRVIQEKQAPQRDTAT